MLAAIEVSGRYEYMVHFVAMGRTNCIQEIRIQTLRYSKREGRVEIEIASSQIEIYKDKLKLKSVAAADTKPSSKSGHLDLFVSLSLTKLRYFRLPKTTKNKNKNK